MKRREKRTLNAVDDDEQNLLDVDIAERRARKSEEREFVF